jgi:hypothetical protein
MVEVFRRFRGTCCLQHQGDGGDKHSPPLCSCFMVIFAVFFSLSLSPPAWPLLCLLRLREDYCTWFHYQ